MYAVLVLEGMLELRDPGAGVESKDCLLFLKEGHLEENRTDSSLIVIENTRLPNNNHGFNS